MRNHGKRKAIKIRHPDCSNLAAMQQNYSGLWRTLGLQVTRTRRGFIVKNNIRTYEIGI